MPIKGGKCRQPKGKSKPRLDGLGLLVKSRSISKKRMNLPIRSPSFDCAHNRFLSITGHSSLLGGGGIYVCLLSWLVFMNVCIDGVSLNKSFTTPNSFRSRLFNEAFLRSFDWRHNINNNSITRTNKKEITLAFDPKMKRFCRNGLTRKPRAEFERKLCILNEKLR